MKAKNLSFKAMQMYKGLEGRLAGRAEGVKARVERGGLVRGGRWTRGKENKMPSLCTGR